MLTRRSKFLRAFAIYSEACMKLIIGLGNPGMKYKNTYHNLGFMVVDAFVKAKKLSFDKKLDCDSKTVKGKINGEDFVIAKPQTYMNLSGVAFKKLVNKYNVNEDDILVIYDDADIPMGHMRARYEGSGGTHNGMRNIIAENNMEHFKRLRIGFQNEELKNKEVALLDFVLSPIEYADKPIFEKCIKEGATVIEDFIKGESFDKIMARVNIFDGTK